MKSFHTQIIRPQRRLAKPKPIYIGSPNARKLPVPECGFGHPARRRRRTAVGGSRRRTAIAIYRSRSAGQVCMLIALPNCTLSPSPLPPLCCVDSPLQERLPWLVLTSIEILNELEVYLLNLGRYSYFTASFFKGILW